MEPTFLVGEATATSTTPKRPLDDAERTAHSKPPKSPFRRKPLRVAGVPEHFNVPWHQAMESGAFSAAGVDVHWIEEPNGTGAMISRLKSGSADVVIALTEGLVQDMVANQSDIRLLGTYVSSPLCWAVSAAGAGSSFNGKVKSVADLSTATWGISRNGSGSHLMATVLASERGWGAEDQKYVIKGKFDKLRNSVNDGTTDAFMWETFTTKPFHDTGECARVGDISTPWPCFMLAARQGVVEARLEDLQRMLAVLHTAAKDFHSAPDTVEVVAKRCEQKPEDVAAWFSTVKISAERFVSQAALERCVDALKKSGQLPKEISVDPASLIDPRLAELRRDIKSMRLYNKPELVTALHRQLAANDLKTGPLKYTDLLSFDQHHYYGTDAIDAVIARADLKPTSRVINIGSGLGGPARYIAGKVGCQVLAIELQDDLHQTASELTTRCGLEGKVHHICGDFNTVASHLQTSSYDCVVSWLTLLHIEDRPSLFKHCQNLLRPGGIFYAGDFFEAGQLTGDEWKILREEVSCPSMFSSVSAYKTALVTAGLKVELADDVTPTWKEFVKSRHLQFAKDEAKLTGLYGPEVYGGLACFFETIHQLYDGGNLGGINIYAQKPLGW